MDAVTASKYYGDMHSEKHDLAQTPIIFEPNQLYFAAAPGRQQATLATIDRYLAAWQHQPDSVYYDIISRWHSLTLRSQIPNLYWWALAAAAGMLLSAILATLVLRKRVREKTRELTESQGKLSAILDGTDSIIYIKDRDLRLQYVNRAGLRAGRACRLRAAARAYHRGVVQPGLCTRQYPRPTCACSS